MVLHVLVFSCENNTYALPLESVERVLRALEITAIPESPPVLAGVFDLHGHTIPVISLRHLLSLPAKNMELEDALMIVNVHAHQTALLSDHVIGVFELEREKISETPELFDALVMTPLVRWEERLIPLLDIDRLIDQEILHLHAQEENS
ncbi:MAG: chemotaxis protein CheW [Sulfuricurvum sp.]|jgi:purine-binding chemotaxis protein CheW|uniref:chemotaxis protein CheW n=1 Tax=Sulfuricurvum sp. TaxID=2025608 RepID=UPI0025F078CF|nr:chemotaxis protein CheW [Sulfuricurvum sp.]MCK9373548.1 chemotaxis protein CheW [Sulfuricurvum sp.]